MERRAGSLGPAERENGPALARAYGLKRSPRRPVSSTSRTRATAPSTAPASRGGRSGGPTSEDIERQSSDPAHCTGPPDLASPRRRTSGKPKPTTSQPPEEREPRRHAHAAVDFYRAGRVQDQMVES